MNHVNCGSSSRVWKPWKVVTVLTGLVDSELFFFFFFWYLQAQALIKLQPQTLRSHHYLFLGFVWISLITENWKYCNKIIFKCMNSSTIGSSFKIVFVEKNTCDPLNSARNPHIKTQMRNSFHSVCIWIVNVSSVCVQTWVPCTIYGTYESLFLAKFSLKMSLTILFTRLKIILLQYFQFSVFNSIK